MTPEELTQIFEAYLNLQRAQYHRDYETFYRIIHENIPLIGKLFVEASNIKRRIPMEL
jgi:hypothetical protein